MLKASFYKIEKALKREVINHYGDRLLSMVIFGSAARGTQRFDSDFDFLIVCDELPKGRLKRIREFEKIENNLQSLLEKLRAHGCNIQLSPLFKTRKEVIHGSPIFLDMIEDSKIIYDRDHFFSKILDRMKERLAALGAKRVWRGSAWYWDLKPDFKPGEIFEI